MQKPVKILQASAGSGKTFSLAAHYLTLLFSGENKYREILAVTFTNKATEEMKSRILEVLLGLAKGDPSGKIEAYRKIILKEHSFLDSVTLQQKAHVIYRKILHDYSRFSVNTIDGFVQKVIRGFAFELGLDSGYSLEMNLEKVKLELSKRLEKQLDEKDVLLKWVIQLALSRINNNKSWNYRKELLDLSSEIFNDKFKDFEAAISGSEDKDVDQIFKHHIDSSESFVKDFKEGITSIAVLAEKVFEESGYQNKDLQGMSRSNLLKFGKIANGELDKVPAVLNLLNDEESWFKKGIENTLFDKLNPLLQQLATVYDSGIAHYTLAGAFLKNGYLLRLMQEIALLLTAYREENDTLLFSDAQKLLNGIAEDAGDNPSFIWEKMGNKYRHFLFDEFQDTSESQWNSFLNLVVNSISTHNGELNDHLIVGDTKQSIYRWRDGDYKLLHSKAGIDLGIQNILEARLEENFRSTEEIINFNNELYPRLAKELQEKINEKIIEDENLNTFWSNEDNKYSTIIENIFEGCAQKSHQNTLKDGMIKIHRIDFGSSESSDFEDAENKKEAALIDMHSEIKILLQERGYKQRELGVIVRTNNEAALVVDFLMKAGLDVLSGEALKIASNIAIRLIINALKLLVVTPSNSALYKANCIALYAQIHDKEIKSDHYFNLKQIPISEMNGVLPKDFCAYHQQWMQLPVPELVEKIIAAFKLDVYSKEDINPFLPYLFAFRDLCGKNSKQGEKGISAFLQWWEEDGSSKNLPSPETANAIQVTTIHKSKGLAFRAVLIPFCSWTLSGGTPNSNFWVPMEHTPYENLKAIPLPYSSSLMGSSVTHRYLEEVLFNYMDALNSLYVATTRAKDYLYIAIPGKKTKTITHIGDVVLSAYSAEFEDDNNKLEIGEFSTLSDKIDTVGILEMQKYPTTKRLEEVYKRTENRPQKYVDNISKSARVGNNLHAILADANLVEEIPKAIDKLVLQGQIDKEEVEDYEKRASNVLSNTELASILSQSATQINEKSIIGINGKAYRPDKLVFNEKSVSIIDYKFTAEESEHHVAQIKNYESLLKAMGYDDVKSYLFYEAKSKLKAV